MKLLLALGVAQTGLLVQISETDFGTGVPEQGRWAWLALGTVLLWLGVARLRSRAARVVLVVGGFTGTILYAVNLSEGFPNAWVFVLGYLLASVPLMTAPVRTWVGLSAVAPTRS